MPRLREYQARQVMADEIAKVGGGYEVSLVRTDGPRSAAKKLDWWYNGASKEGSITPRTRAFLRAYVRIADGNDLYAEGIPLDQGRVHMDKYVIRRLHEDGYLAFKATPTPFFRLTEAGEALLDNEEA